MKRPTPQRFLERLSQWAPVRVICYSAAIVAMAIVAKILTHLFVPPVPSPLHAPLTAARNLLLPTAMFAAYAILVRLIERRAASELDIRRGLTTFLTGSIVGGFLMGTVYWVLWELGMARFSGGTGFEGLGVAIIYNLATAMGEELLFRAVLFRVAEEVAGTTGDLHFSRDLWADACRQSGCHSVRHWGTYDRVRHHDGARLCPDCAVASAVLVVLILRKRG